MLPEGNESSERESNQYHKQYMHIYLDQHF